MAGAIEQDGTRYAWELAVEPAPARLRTRPSAAAQRPGSPRRSCSCRTPTSRSAAPSRSASAGSRSSGAHGGQAHLWGSKHATRWAWAHCNDFTAWDGGARSDTFVDGVSVFVPRFGRELGPNTPVVGRFGGGDLMSIKPVRSDRNLSDFDLGGWRFEATGQRGPRARPGHGSPRGPRRGHLPRPRRRARLLLQHGGRRHAARGPDRARPRSWKRVDELRADGTAHFEYAQRDADRRRRAEDRLSLATASLTAVARPFRWRDDGDVLWLEARLGPAYSDLQHAPRRRERRPIPLTQPRDPHGRRQ